MYSQDSQIVNSVMSDIGTSVTGSTGKTVNTGLTGYTGYTGRTGYTGYTGKIGYTGYTGIAGCTGYTGYTGIAGYTGRTGYTGYTGVFGRTGYTGYTGGGYTGRTGYTGYTGPQGAATNTGATGYTGYTGSAGSASSTGATGYTGRTGYTGYTGRTGYTGYTGPAANLGGLVPYSGATSNVNLGVYSLIASNLRGDNITIMPSIVVNVIADPLGANNNNLDISDHSWIRFNISGSGSFNITGISGGIDGRLLFLTNNGSYADEDPYIDAVMSLVNESPDSDAINRIRISNNVDVITNKTIILVYDGTLRRWTLISFAV